MKKLILTACVALAGMFSLNAQKLSYRAEVGANVTAKYLTGGTVPGKHLPNFGVRAGLGAEYMFSSNMYLASGLNYRMGGLESTFDTPQGKIKSALREHNLSLPINVGGRFAVNNAFAVVLEGGPFLSYTFSSKRKTGSRGAMNEVNRKPFELGVGLSVVTEFQKCYFLRLGADFGLTDVQKERKGSLRKMTDEIYLTFGVRF